MEGDGADSLWRAMSVIEGGQGTSAEAKEMPERIVTAVDDRLQAGEMQEPLTQGETGWQGMYGSWYKGEGWDDRRRFRRGR